MARTEPEQRVRDEQGRDEQARRRRLRDELARGGRARADARPTRDEAPRTDRPGGEKSRADHPRDPRAPLRPPLGLLVSTGAVLLVASVAVAVTIGPAHLGFGEVARSVASHLGLRVAPVPTLHDAIVWDPRRRPPR